MPLYGVDVASYQGHPNWSRVHRAGIRYGFSKVTEGLSYRNPTWDHNRAGMLALADDFVPGCYHFLHRGNGREQARFFLRHAGDLDRFAVALDVEAHGADGATARAWVDEFKDRTGGHPVLGYYPRWYWQQTGRPNLEFFDAIWQSRYVEGTGSAAVLYRLVPTAWWAEFGGQDMAILQFSSSASVPGIAGRCDINAYRGNLEQLRALALGEDDMPTAKEIAEAVWKHPIKASWMPKGSDDMWQADTHLGVAHAHVRKLEAAAAAQQATIDKLVDALAAGAGGGVDLEALKAEIRAAIESVQVRLEVEE